MGIKISDDHLINVCKYRQGASTCKYITYMIEHKRFCCAKGISEMKDKIDSESGSMTAKGHNCKGLTCDENDL